MYKYNTCISFIYICFNVYILLYKYITHVISTYQNMNVKSPPNYPLNLF